MKTILITALTVVIAGLVVGACDDRYDRTVGQKIDSALERTQKKLAAAGDKISAAGDKIAQQADSAITASIKTDFLKDPDLSILKIDVETRDGVVSLNGLAENDEARVRAERIAQGVKGVKEVHNYLVTKRV